MCRDARFGLVALLAACGRLGFDGGVPLDGNGDTSTSDASTADALAVLEGCVVHLAMEEASWTGATDDAANGCGGLTGRALGGATVVDDPTRGRVAEFVGDPSCIELGDAPSVRPTDQLTMSAWLYPTALDGTTPYGIISKRAGYLIDSQYTLFLWNANEPYIDLDSEDDRFRTGVAVANNAWVQLTVVFDGRLAAAQRVRVYRNGVLEFTGFESSATVANLTSPLMVGCMPDMQGSEVSFVGRLDDVAVWTRALDATEVSDWYLATTR